VPGDPRVPTLNYEISAPTPAPSPCERTIKAHVVALDQVFFWNRLGAVQPHGMIFALRHHVVPTDGTNKLKPGRVRLRADKRPRPLVLRMNVGDCLRIDFQNLLLPEPRHEDQPATRTASIHVAGLQLVNTIRDDGSNVGRNPSPPGGLVAPGGRITYTLYADRDMREGSHILFSAAATTTAEGDGGQIPPGLFGAVNVEPRGAEWYRSQLSHNDMRLASRRANGKIRRTESLPQADLPVNGGHPVINYDAVYPSWHRYRGQPILKILNRHNVIVHSDLTAIITGPDRGKFPAGTYPPSTLAAPNRDWPFREQTLIYHDEIGAVQAFPQFEQEGPGQLGPTLHGSRDAFAINYGTGGIGAEILANRIGVGPMAECDECLFEEFFLSAWTVGDPAMVVDVPANAPCWPERLEKGECNGLHQNAAPGYKATKVFYPHDPSNVYHGYLNDHTKQRVLHAGPKEHHIHHLHAHQWFKSSDGTEGSSYNDSQAIGPGSSHNIEIAYGGGGNRNLTAGDSIFHCHFYPHFAQGMWALWRVHDVFEEGTPLDRWGRPAVGARALPDAEIKRGTPIPAIVPLPGKLVLDNAGKEDPEKTVNYVMAPMPGARVEIGLDEEDRPTGQIKVSGAGNPGFPFFVPGIAGRRVPHPPLDLAFDIVREEGTGIETRRYRDGGLPRHIIQDAEVASHHETRFSFDKEISDIDARRLPEEGTGVEQEAMEYHERDFHVSYRTDESRGPFMTNGVGRALGAPYANPCVNHRWDERGRPILKAEKFGRDVTYKGVMFQFDMKINKKGWHFPQSRIESLWEDWKPTISENKPPEPLFFRANVNDCVTFHHANLIPKVYVQDDFQVRTPTDIVGQHIHLVKFDVTSSDGAGNGWNYEDGTFGPEEVEHRIKEINKKGGLLNPDGIGRHKLRVKEDPFFGVPTQVTIQRWLIDNITPDASGDPNRTLRNAFTHDHFGPSTHQQTGLYAGLIIEPLNSDWFHNESGERLGRGSGDKAPREDGGPTSWQAVIIPPDKSQSYREFLLQVADFQLAYEKDGGVNEKREPIPDPLRAINPPGRHAIPLSGNVTQLGGPFDAAQTKLLERPARQGRGCPTGDSAAERGCPEIISADDPGTFSVNYRNEPIPLRVRNPATNTQASGEAGDLSLVYKSIRRTDTDLNNIGPYPDPLTDDVAPEDPFTPILRTGDGDRVQVRIFVGAHEEGHNFTINGVKWLFEPFDPNSGWRNSQMVGISEKYDFILRGRAPQGSPGTTSMRDFLYRPGAAVDDQWNGVWGLLRTYQTERTQQRFFESREIRERQIRLMRQRGERVAPPPALPPFPLPSEVFESRASLDLRAESLDPKQRLQKFDDAIADGACPIDKKFSPRRSYEVFAYRADDILREQRLEFTGQNGRNFYVNQPSDDHRERTLRRGPLNDPTAIIFVRKDHIGPDGKYNRSRVEPLILRAVAGECIEVKLTNKLPAEPYDLPGYNTFPMIVDDFNANQVVPSRQVGLHPQLVHYDVRKGDGMNVGRNPVQTVGPGDSITYYWYAGDVGIDRGGNRRRATPVEFGAVNLSSSDPIKHSNKSAIGSLIVEPAGSKWTEDPDSTHAATVQPVGCDNSPGQQPCPEKFAEFREFVIQFQNDLNLRFDDRSPVPNLAEAEDPEDSGQKAFNYRTEPFWTRLCYWPALPLTGGSGTATQCPLSNAQSTRQLDMTNSLHNSQIRRPDPDPPDNPRPVDPDPVTPVFTAPPGVPVRFRVLHSGGHARNSTFMLHGHVWQEMPYRTVPSAGVTVRPDEPASNVIGFNPTSPWHGAQWGHGPSNHFDVVLSGAGGRFLVQGDYLYRTFQSFQFDGGMWGLFRVGTAPRGDQPVR
jgi:hypothetical protein